MAPQHLQLLCVQLLSQGRQQLLLPAAAGHQDASTGLSKLRPKSERNGWVKHQPCFNHASTMEKPENPWFVVNSPENPWFGVNLWEMVVRHFLKTCRNCRQKCASPRLSEAQSGLKTQTRGAASRRINRNLDQRFLGHICFCILDLVL